MISSRARSKRGEVEVHDPRQFAQHGVDVVGVLAHQRDAVVLFVARQKHAVAVEDQPAFGRQKPDVDPVFLGQQAKIVGAFDLKIAHARRPAPPRCRRTPAHDRVRRPIMRLLSSMSLALRFTGRSLGLSQSGSRSAGPSLRKPNTNFETATTWGRSRRSRSLCEAEAQRRQIGEQDPQDDPFGQNHARPRHPRSRPIPRETGTRSSAGACAGGFRRPQRPAPSTGPVGVGTGNRPSGTRSRSTR
jgi:hypothetical protein